MNRRYGHTRSACELVRYPALLDRQRTLHLLLLDPSPHPGVLRQRHQVEVEVPDGDARRPRPGRRHGRGGHGAGHRHAVPVVAALVPAERLARGEAPAADGAPVRPAAASPSRPRRRRLV